VLTVDSTGTYAISVNGVPLFNEVRGVRTLSPLACHRRCDAAMRVQGSVSATLNGQWYSTLNGSLALTGGTGVNGTGRDNLGPFTNYTQTWSAVGGKAAGQTVATTFVCYEVGAFTFGLSYPAGAQDVNGSYVGSDDVHGSCLPTSAFPSFPTAGGLGSDAGWLIYAGIWTLWEFWGVGLDHAFTNCQMGPVHTFNTTFEPSTSAPAWAPAHAPGACLGADQRARPPPVTRLSPPPPPPAARRRHHAVAVRQFPHGAPRRDARPRRPRRGQPLQLRRGAHGAVPAARLLVPRGGVELPLRRDRHRVWLGLHHAGGVQHESGDARRPRHHPSVVLV
jgi:hypothetical protein